MFPNTEEENLTTMILLVTIVLIGFVCFVVLLAYLFTTKKNKLLREKQLMQAQFKQELLQTQIEIQSQTLQTVSQEIHDNLGQVLSLIKLNLGAIAATETAANQTKLTNTKQLVSKAIGDLRELSQSLYGNKIAELGLVQAIDNELKILQNSGQFKTSLKITGNAFKLNPQKEIVVFRMMQESINNAIKHARAKNIEVGLKYEAASFTLSITDDGIGFDPADLKSSTQTGMGLKSMKSRARLIGADFSVNSIPGQGATVSVSVPDVS
ncbi:MAG: sensor histidine kinase [Ferruginibacter sp.]|nr:sensor histidine kinase [Ferruginibacter sp.]